MSERNPWPKLSGEGYLIAIFYLAREQSRTLTESQVFGLLDKLRHDGMPEYESKFEVNVLGDLQGLRARRFIEEVSGYSRAKQEQKFPDYYRFSPSISTKKLEYAKKIIAKLPELCIKTIGKELKHPNHL